MIVDDVFQRRLRDIAARYHKWSSTYTDNAAFEVEDANGYWRFSCTPRLANACPFEILIHQNNKVDFFIADQIYEERLLEPLEQLLPIVNAIANGHVITRTWRSTNSGMILKIETVIAMDDNSSWSNRHDFAVGINIDSTPRQKRDRHYVPYKR